MAKKIRTYKIFCFRVAKRIYQNYKKGNMRTEVLASLDDGLCDRVVEELTKLFLQDPDENFIIKVNRQFICYTTIFILEREFPPIRTIEI